MYSKLRSLLVLRRGAAVMSFFGGGLTMLTAPLIGAVVRGCLVALLAAAAVQGDLLSDYFDVTLEIDTDHPHTDSLTGDTTYHFLYSSFAPGPSAPGGMSYVVDDWHGSWEMGNPGAERSDLVYEGYEGGNPTGGGQLPAGGEPYDVEAIYANTDASNLYIAIVTSLPLPGVDPYPDSTTPPNLVVAGDLALDLGLNGDRTSTDDFGYDYAVNIVHETRPSSGNVAAFTQTVAGTDFYRTANSDWYVGTPDNAVTADSEHTNFDPDYDGGRGTFIDDVTTAYYELDIDDEGHWGTYVIEATIPISLFGSSYVGQTIGMRFSPGCRNDGTNTYAVLRHEHVPEPSSLLLTAVLAAAFCLRRTRRRAG